MIGEGTNSDSSGYKHFTDPHFETEHAQERYDELTRLYFEIYFQPDSDEDKALPFDHAYFLFEVARNVTLEEDLFLNFRARDWREADRHEQFNILMEIYEEGLFEEYWIPSEDYLEEEPDQTEIYQFGTLVHLCRELRERNFNTEQINMISQWLLSNYDQWGKWFTVEDHPESIYYIPRKISEQILPYTDYIFDEFTQSREESQRIMATLLTQLITTRGLEGTDMNMVDLDTIISIRERIDRFGKSLGAYNFEELLTVGNNMSTSVRALREWSFDIYRRVTDQEDMELPDWDETYFSHERVFGNVFSKR